MNVLLTCAGRRNYLVNYFKEALNGSGNVIATDIQLNAPALVDADIAIEVPSIYSSNYIKSLHDICRAHAVQAIISLNDLELPILAASKVEFEQLGVTIIVSDLAVIDICFDKWKTTKFLQENGVNTPEAFLSIDDALEAVNSGKLTFPLVIKPRWGSASIGIEFPESEEELRLAYQLLSVRLSKTILADASKEDIDHAIIIQEKLNGQEFGLDVLNDLNGNHVASFPKKKLAMRAGETDKSVSVHNERLTEIGAKLGSSLRHIGNLDCDVFEREDGFYVLELNPRFGGGYPFTHEAGGNIVAALVEWLKGSKDVAKLLDFKPDLAFSKCDRLMSVPI
jgi:carbamoyl-phosphate synthase large subunit